MFFEPPMGCGFFARKVPAEAYPEIVGKYKRNEVIHEGINEISTEYSNSERPRQHTIRIGLDSVKNAQEAEGYLQLSTAKCSTENLANNSKSKLLSNYDLKDKSGNKAGIIRICEYFEQDAANYFVEMTNGNIAFFIRTNNLNGEKDRNEPLSLNELTEFTANIPHNQNLENLK
jgi:hypothetical protein